MHQGLDNDSWGLLAEGREIVNNGIYYTDKLSMHEGLNTVVQNYGFAILFYWVFQLFGGPGIFAAMLVLNFSICFLIYKICQLISNDNKNLSLLLMIVTDVMLALLGFVVTRAQMVSFVIFLSLIYILELYIKSKQAKILWWIPILSLLQVNLHASLWPMLFLVILTYVVDSFVVSHFLHKKSYDIKPLLMVNIVSMLMGLINPYGLNMLTIMTKVYGETTFVDTVLELHPFRPLEDIESIIFYLSLIGVVFSYIYCKKQNVRIRYLLLLFGFLTLGLNTVKGLSQVVLVMFFPLALLYKDVKTTKIIKNPTTRKALVTWIIILVFSAFIILCPAVTLSVPSDHPNQELVKAVNSIDEFEKHQKDSLKIYTGYDTGGYVEYRGYKPYLDPRGGDFMKVVNGKEDIFQEWIDFRNGKIPKEQLLEKYNFDYLLVKGENDPFYKSKNKSYKILFNNEEHQLEVYKKI